jgi:ketosteroid isomerase-like protein
VARYARSWAEGDLAGVLDAYAPDVVFHYAGESGLAGDHIGRDDALAAMAAATVRTGRELLVVEDVLGGDTMAAIVARERLGGREVQRVLLYRTERDRLRECWLYDEDQRYVDTLWGPEGPSAG